MRKIVAFISFWLSAASYSQDVISENELALLTIIGNYVNGFKEFDTSVVVLEDSVRIGIYFDTTTQEIMRAESLAIRFRNQVAILLEQKGFKDITAIVSVYGEDRAQGY